VVGFLLSFVLELMAGTRQTYGHTRFDIGGDVCSGSNAYPLSPLFLLHSSSFRPLFPSLLATCSLLSLPFFTSSLQSLSTLFSLPGGLGAEPGLPRKYLTCNTRFCALWCIITLETIRWLCTSHKSAVFIFVIQRRLSCMACRLCTAVSNEAFSYEA